MDHSSTSTDLSAAAVRAVGPGPIQLLLSSAAGILGEPVLHAMAGPGIHRTTVLRRGEDDGRIAEPGPSGGAQTSAAVAPGNGIDGGLRQTSIESQSIGAQALSLSVKGRGHRAPQSGLEHRYHLHSLARRVCLLGCD